MMAETWIRRILMVITFIGSMASGTAQGTALSSPPGIAPEAAAQPMHQKATWLWTTDWIRRDPREVLSFFGEHGVNLVYLQVNPDIPASDYQRFIKQAAKPRHRSGCAGRRPGMGTCVEAARDRGFCGLGANLPTSGGSWRTISRHSRRHRTSSASGVENKPPRRHQAVGKQRPIPSNRSGPHEAAAFSRYPVLARQRHGFGRQDAARPLYDRAVRLGHGHVLPGHGPSHRLASPKTRSRRHPPSAKRPWPPSKPTPAAKAIS